MSDLNVIFDRLEEMQCGVCNGEGKIDEQKCPYCGGKGVYGQKNDIEIVDLGEF